MGSTANETFDRIQREIQEALEREEELRQKYYSLNNNNNNDRVDGYKTPTPSPEPVASPPRTRTPSLANGTDSTRQARVFTPTASSKGVMQKFLKSHGKLNPVTMKQAVEPTAISFRDDTLVPAKITIEAGKPIRNGYIPAEEKMRRELQEFQRREAELRLERRKSQPDLMAALEKEQEAEAGLKAARSMALMYSSEDLTDNPSSAVPSLKPARSLADLCDFSEELESRRTHSLIMQFESLSSQS